MRKFSLWAVFLTALISLTQCVNVKEFQSNRFRNSAIVLEKSTSVEKKTAINVLVRDYLDQAPADADLLSYFNALVVDELKAIGYDHVYWKEDFPTSIPALKWKYHVQLETLELKEFKVKEYMSDSTSGTTKTVKLKGIETTGKAVIAPMSDATILSEFNRNASCSERDEESQEGYFATSVGIGDLIRKDKDGSVKYQYEVSSMSQEIFFEQIERVAARLAREIDERMIDIYRKQESKKK